MTPEEQAMLEQYLAQQQLMQRSEMDPLALSANAYGQGPGYLGLEDRPDSWSRLGDKNQIYRDMFQMTGTDMAEFVPGLYDYVPQPKPGDLDPYQSDATSLFANNPVYQEIERQVANGVDIVTATNAVRTAYEQNPEALAGSLPMGNPEYGRAEPDWEAVNRNATTYLSERNKERAGQSEVDSLRAQYEDFVRERTAYDKAAETQDVTWAGNRDDVMRMMGYNPNERTSAPTQIPAYDPMSSKYTPLQVAPARGGDTTGVAGWADDVGNSIENGISSLGLEWGRIGEGEDGAKIPYPKLTRQRTAKGTIGDLGDRQYDQPPAPRRFPGRSMKDIQRQQLDPKIEIAKQKELNAQSVFDAANRIAKSKNVGSKKEENLAKLTAFYNTLMYGQ